PRDPHPFRTFPGGRSGHRDARDLIDEPLANRGAPLHGAPRPVTVRRRGRMARVRCVSEKIPPERRRASDSDRDRVLRVLREAAADGRIDLAEFEERSTLVHKARTLGELPGVTADLLPVDEQPVRLDPQPVMGLFTSLSRKGRWVAYP